MALRKKYLQSKGTFFARAHLIENAISIDVEDWYQGVITINFKDWPNHENRISQNIEKVLKILDKSKVTATFFALGYVAENFPEIIERIKRNGHELASHGYSHKLIYKQSPEEFEDDLLKSVRILERITGEKILGYRAPYFSIVKETSWAIDIMEKIGLKYDSSIFPIKTYLYGVPESPRHPYRPSKQDITSNDSNRNFIEFPLSTYNFFGFNIPISGGFYLRFLPYWIVKRGIKKINKNGYPAIIYIHPWELDPNKPKLKLSYREIFIHYHNLKKTETILQNLLKDFKFSSIREVLPLE